MKKSKLSAVDNWCALAEQAGFKPAALATLVGVSLAALERFFHALTGRSPENWLNELRLRIAALRLAAGVAISELVRDLGFYDRSQFHHQFRELFHQTPGERVVEWKRREAEWIAHGGSGRLRLRQATSWRKRCELWKRNCEVARSALLNRRARPCALPWWTTIRTSSAR